VPACQHPSPNNGPFAPASCLRTGTESGPDNAAALILPSPPRQRGRGVGGEGVIKHGELTLAAQENGVVRRNLVSFGQGFACLPRQPRENRELLHRPRATASWCFLIVGLVLPGLFVQNFTDLLRQGQWRERLLQEVDLFVQDAMPNHCIIRIAAQEQHFHLW